MSFYKRSVFLINPSFQLSFSLVVSSIIFISSLIYPLILMDFFNELVTKFPGLQLNVKNAQTDLMIFLAIIQLVFISLVFIFFIFMTHKIAGPMHKLKSHLADIRNGQPITPLSFRNGDHFHDVAEEVSSFLESITKNHENDFKYLDEVALFVENLAPIVPDDKKPVLNEISNRLMEIKSRYKSDP